GPRGGAAGALRGGWGGGRGPPLAGVTGRWAEEVRGRWQRRRLDAVVQWGELQLRLGRAAAVISTVPDLAAEYPLAEPPEGLLMRALHAARPDAEAGGRVAALRQGLAGGAGTGPAPGLGAGHAAILGGELPAPDRRSPLATPAQLPPDVPGFAGREQELRHLDGVLGTGSRAARVVVVSGTAGVGKTALAGHWADRARGGFPGRALDPSLRRVHPARPPGPPRRARRA